MTGGPAAGYVRATSEKARSGPARPAAKKTVLFLCTHNSARSQMAEGLANSLFGDRLEARSAGTMKTGVSPYAVRVMAEIGIDLSGHSSKTVEEFLGQVFDLVVTVCDQAREACPFFPGRKIVHRAFEDPGSAGGSEAELLARFRRVRDEIRRWIEEVLPAELPGKHFTDRDK